METEEGEQGALTRATEGERLPFAPDLERTEQAKFQSPLW